MIRLICRNKSKFGEQELVLWPTSNWIVLAVAGVCLAILGLLAPPLAGFTICFFLWRNLSWKAWIAGGIWMLVGIVFEAIKTKGFRGDLVDFELPPEEPMEGPYQGASSGVP